MINSLQNPTSSDNNSYGKYKNTQNEQRQLKTLTLALSQKERGLSAKPKASTDAKVMNKKQKTQHELAE